MLREDDWEWVERVIGHTVNPLISAASYVELFVVLTRRFDKLILPLADQWLEDLGIQTMPFDEEQARIARDAFRRFGKGRHPAALNFGDCFSYALATYRRKPLLFKGEDFSRTDVEVVACA